MDRISIQFTLFSAFYSPLISTMSGGFLRAEGLDPEWSISPPGIPALAALKDGSAHVVQSALSQGLLALDKGETPAAVHFAQVNEMDGFFLTGRDADPAFTWDKLEGAEVVMFKGGQPSAAIASAEKPYFPDIDETVLADCIATYQRLGCWTPHVEITRAAYEKTQDVFEYVGLLKQRHRYEQVCAAPPAMD